MSGQRDISVAYDLAIFDDPIHFDRLIWRQGVKTFPAAALENRGIACRRAYLGTGCFLHLCVPGDMIEVRMARSMILIEFSLKPSVATLARMMGADSSSAVSSRMYPAGVVIK